MCIQMLKKSTKELNHFTNLQLSSMDHQVDPAEQFPKNNSFTTQTSNLPISSDFLMEIKKYQKHSNTLNSLLGKWYLKY